MKQKIYLAAKTILFFILGLLIYPAYLAARESKVEPDQKIYTNRYYLPLSNVQY